MLYDLFINKNFQSCKTKLLVLGIRGTEPNFGTLDLETELAKDIDRIRFSKNVSLYENSDLGSIDDYLKNGDKFGFRDVRAGKVVVRVMKVEDVTKEYVGDFVGN